eukprot:3947846-Prymnesium_polylepis.2
MVRIRSPRFYKVDVGSVKTTFGEQMSPNGAALCAAPGGALLQRYSSAPDPRAPISTAHLHVTHAKRAHEQCTAARTTACAHTT